MTQHVKFGLNVDPNTGGLPIAERITAIADDSGLNWSASRIIPTTTASPTPSPPCTPNHR